MSCFCCLSFFYCFPNIFFLTNYTLFPCSRPCFSPDGALLITPTGIHRPIPMKDIKEKEGKDKNITDADYEKRKSFCTHIFIRSQLSIPAISLIGLEEPSTAVRFSPILYKMVTSSPSPISSTSLPCSGSGGSYDHANDDSEKIETLTAANTAVSGSLGDKKDETKIDEKSEERSMIPGNYRMMFAVVTISSVLVYDTQHEVLHHNTYVCV